MSITHVLARRLTHPEELELLAQQEKLKAAMEETDRQRGQLDGLVLELKESGCRTADIADVLGVDRSSVYLMLDRARGR